MMMGKDARLIHDEDDARGGCIRWASATANWYPAGLVSVLVFVQPQQLSLT